MISEYQLRRQSRPRWRSISRQFARRGLLSITPLFIAVVLSSLACGGGDDIPKGAETPIDSIRLPRPIEGELELWSGTMTTGAFNLGKADAYGYTTGVTLLGRPARPTGGPHGTLDDTSFSYRGLTHTIELMTYVKGIDNSDVFIVGFNEGLLFWDLDMALYINGHRLSYWSTSYLHGRIDTSREGWWDRVYRYVLIGRVEVRRHLEAALEVHDRRRDTTPVFM